MKSEKSVVRWQLKYLIPIVYFLILIVFTSCQTPPTDLRSLAPAETIVYLETADLGEMLKSLTESKSFSEIVKNKPDFSILENTQAAVIVTGFESSEKQLGDEAAILNFKPQFVLIADTHSWERTNVSLVENQIAVFLTKIYGDSLKLEKSEKSSIRFYVWTAEDNRKIYAAIAGSLIYLGNNEGAVDKCLAVKRGGAENLLKNENLTLARQRGEGRKLAFGYISSEGISQIANLTGVKVAVEAAEEDLAKSFIAKILPPLMQKTVREISWSAQKNEQGIEDKIYIKPDAQISDIWKETLIPAAESRFQTAELIPANFDSVTRYNLQNPQIAWRSIVLTFANKLDNFDGKIWLAASGSFFAPYGIADAEIFLSAIKPEIITVRLNSESLAIVEVSDEAKVKSAIIKEINFNTPPEKIGAANLWKSTDDEQSAAFIENKLILGNRSDILNCLKALDGKQNFARTKQFQALAKTNALTITIAGDSETNRKVINVLGNKREDANPAGFYTTETRFNNYGIERRTVSDFGLIGSLISQFDRAE